MGKLQAVENIYRNSGGKRGCFNLFPEEAELRIDTLEVDGSNMDYEQ